jgi:flagellar protein FlgJ
MSEKVENYVTKNWEHAKAAAERFNMDPMVILAQGAQESGWGTSNLSVNHNNFFGFTAGGKPNEFWDGRSYEAQNKYKLKFRVYNSPKESFLDFARLIESKYKAAHAAGKDYKTYAQRIAYSPYISEKNGDNREGYKNGIIGLYEKIAAAAKKKALK